MGAFAYVAVHLRRNDFQYEKAGDATSHLVRLQAELKEGEGLYAFLISRADLAVVSNGKGTVLSH